MIRHRLLLLGNSHLAALKLGSEKIGSKQHDVELSFFGAPSRWTERADFENGIISTPHRPLAEKFIQVSGTDSVSVHGFDAIALIGMFFGFTNLLRLVRDIHFYGMAPLRPRSQLVSRSCLEQILFDSLNSSPALEWGRKIKSEFRKPIFFVPTPLPAENFFESDPFVSRVAGTFRRHLHELYELYARTALKTTTAAGLQLLQQPVSTIASVGLTKLEFSRGSVRLLGDNRGHCDDDYTHMNEAFGVRMLEEIIFTVGRSIDGAGHLSSPRAQATA